MNWIYRGGRADLVPEDVAGDNAPLIAAVKETNWLPGQVQVFIHGEAQAVMHNLRRYIRKERGVDASGPTRSPAIGGAAVPRRRSASGSVNSPKPKPKPRPKTVAQNQLACASTVVPIQAGQQIELRAEWICASFRPGPSLGALILSLVSAPAAASEEEKPIETFTCFGARLGTGRAGVIDITSIAGRATPSGRSC